MANGNSPPRDEGVVAAVPADAQPRARLTQLKINHFRHVKPGTELHFDDGINVLLGRNGTGKTTLLDLICALAAQDLRAYREESFDFECRLTLGTLGFSLHVQHTMRELAHSRSPNVVASMGRRSAWQYDAMAQGTEGTISASVNGQGARVTYESNTASFEEHHLFEHGFFISQLFEAGMAREPLSSALLRSLLVGQELFSSCLRLDEGIDVFRLLTEGKDLPRLGMPMHLHLHEGFEDIPEGAYAARTVFRGCFEAGADVHHLTELSFDRDRLPFLHELARIFNVRDVQLTMPLEMRSTSEQSGTTMSFFGTPVFRVTNHRDTTFTHDQLSYGEKRLLAFMYHAAASPEVLVADEIVNGMHYEWIDACLAAIRGQAFLTSQNPLLLDHLSFESAEEVQRRFILCDLDDDGSWTWRNMDLDTADSFFRAYSVGLQHVGEILRTSGLW